MKHIFHIFSQVFKVACALSLIFGIFWTTHNYSTFFVPVKFEDELASIKNILQRMPDMNPSKMQMLAVAIRTASRLTGLSEELIASLTYSESMFNKNAVSPAGYKGLMQVPEALWDPDVNVLRGCKILVEKMIESKGNLKTALILYKGYTYKNIEKGEKDAERVIGWARRLHDGKVIHSGEI